MSDKDNDQAAPAEDEAAEEAGPVEQNAAEEAEPVAEDVAEASTPVDKPAAAEVSPRRGGASIAWLSFVVAILALSLAGYVAWQSRQSARDTATEDRVSRLETRVTGSTNSLGELESRLDELGQRDPGVDAADLDALRREFEERVRLLSSLPARISTLESSVASLAGVSEGARDAWVLAEAEYYMQIANAQLQLANNPHLATLALRMADERIVQLANPGLTDVRRALADELAALELMNKPDVEGATLTLASLARVVEALPLASEAEAGDDDGPVDPELSGAGRAWASVKNAMSGLVKVTPPERAKLAVLSPDSELFLRSNLALQLQSARLALLRGEQAIFEQSLDDTSALLRGYFDLDSAQVAATLETIAEVRDQVFTSDMPDISGSLELLRQFRTLNENAQ